MNLMRSLLTHPSFSLVFCIHRMVWSQKQGGSETTVVTAFYTLIFLTGSLRAVWFLIPNDWLQPSYTPSAIMAFGDEPWVGTFINSLIVVRFGYEEVVGLKVYVLKVMHLF